MSEMTPQSQQAVPDGYAQRTIQVNGIDMTFTFYMGFASRVSYTPKGGSEILVYQQEGTFRVPGGGGPAAQSTMWITGGPDSLDVVLEINDGPRNPPEYKGTIEDFHVTTKKAGGGGQGNDKVRVLKGDKQVTKIDVQPRGSSGSVRPHMPEDGGTTGVTNHAATCPPVC